MQTHCSASTSLTPEEARRLNSLPNVSMEADTLPVSCDFAPHRADVLHTACVLGQEADGLDVLWWLEWGDDGQREIRTAPGCRKIVREETCLLIKGHPGNCDQEIGFTREELREGLQ